MWRGRIWLRGKVGGRRRVSLGRKRSRWSRLLTAQENFASHPRAVQARLDLPKRRITRGGAVVDKRGEAAVVGRSQPVEGQEARGLEHAVANLLGGFHIRVGGIDHADKDELFFFQTRANGSKNPGTVPLARKLN